MHFHLELLLKKNQDIPIAGKVASKRHARLIKRWSKESMKQHHSPMEIAALITKVMAGFLGLCLLFLSVIVSSANLRGAHPGYTMRSIALFGLGVLLLLPNRKIVAGRATWIAFLLAVQLLIAIFIAGFVYEGHDSEWETPGLAYFIGFGLLFNIGTFSAFLARSHDRGIHKGMLQQPPP